MIKGVSKRVHLAAGIVTLSLIVIVCARDGDPRMGLGGWNSDHYSHTMATVLFWEVGLEIYRRPIRSLCWDDPPAELTARVAEAWRVNPVDICWPKSDTFDRPLAINWQAFPRPYPPGVLVYFLPEAMLYRYGDASFTAINRVSLVKLAVVAHLAWMLLASLFIRLGPSLIGWILIAFSYSQLMFWSLAGVYDGVAVVGIALAMTLIKEDRFVEALTLLCAALFMHFRVMWHFPLMGVALYGTAAAVKSIIRGPGSWMDRRQEWGLLGLSALLLGWSGVSFGMLWPYLREFPLNNPLHLEHLKPSARIALAYFLPTAFLGGLMAWRRMWLPVVYLAWCSLFFIATPQIKPWHALGLLPVLALASFRGKQAQRLDQTVVVFLWYLVVMHVVFKANPTPAWVAELFR